MHIVLLGYMGSGKTTYGKKLAKQLSVPFYDLDSVVEHHYKVKVFDIFQKYGEDCFRILEREALKAVLDMEENAILSLGGGTPCFFDNMKLIKQSSKSVYIQLSVKSLFDRLLHSKNKRPSIANFDQEQLLSFVKKQLKKREQYYKQADLIVKGENLIIPVLMEKIKSIIFE